MMDADEILKLAMDRLVKAGEKIGRLKASRQFLEEEVQKLNSQVKGLRLSEMEWMNKQDRGDER